MTRIIVADALDVVADGLRYRLADRSDLEIVAHAATGTELLDQLMYIEADLILLDVSLPGKDGIDTMRTLHRRFPGIRVLAYSALVAIEYVNSMLIEGADGYLVKGGDKEELIEAIRTTMAGGCHISPAARESVSKGYAYCDKRMDGEYIGLSQREREVIVLIAQERTNEEIGEIMHISPDTVKTHRKRVMTKLNVRTSAGLVKYAHDRRWV
ncbi:MAG: response regulator transcription factor [Flavobacteriales bacterium]|jgi:DNA-binding NarL/FixJ family response regulator|nr:response regulator transcription factor [Flavobacteriales bacterium]